MRFLFLIILLFSTCFYASCQMDKVVQMEPAITAELGSNVTILCNYSSDFVNKVSWYKQTIGKRPLLVADSHIRSKEVTFYNGFDKNNHYIVHIEDNSYALKIVEIQKSDSATYYCAIVFMNVITFGDGTVLMIKGAPFSSYTILQQTILNFFNPGDSMTLQCTLFTGGCVGEHTVYWFRHGSGESHPGLIYAHGDKSDQCKKSSEIGSPTQSCVYELPKRNLSFSDVGSYYCAVAACGEILLGSGTTLINGTNMETCKVLVLVLATLNIITIIVVIMLTKILQKYRQKDTLNGQTIQYNQVDNEDSLNYAALSFSRKSASSKKARAKSSKDESVYTQVKL